MLRFETLVLAVHVQRLSMVLYISCPPVSHKKPNEDVPGCTWQESSSCEGCQAKPLQWQSSC